MNYVDQRETDQRDIVKQLFQNISSRIGYLVTAAKLLNFFVTFLLISGHARTEVSLTDAQC